MTIQQNGTTMFTWRPRTAWLIIMGNKFNKCMAKTHVRFKSEDFGYIHRCSFEIIFQKCLRSIDRVKFVFDWSIWEYIVNESKIHAHRRTSVMQQADRHTRNIHQCHARRIIYNEHNYFEEGLCRINDLDFNLNSWSRSFLSVFHIYIVSRTTCI